jgi:anti-sigma factor RsiW
MKGCRDWEDALAARLTGDDDDARAEDFRRHLERCDACRTELSQLEQVVTILRRHAHRGGVRDTPDHATRSLRRG